MKDTICIFNEARSSDLICTDFIYETSAIQERTVSRDGYVLGIVEGSTGVLFTEGREIPLAIGDLFLVPRATPYRLHFSRDVAYYYIVFYGRRAEELVSRFRGAHTVAVFKAGGETSTLLSFCRECIEKAKHQSRDLFGEAALLYLLAHLDAEAASPDLLLARMIELTHESYASPSFSLASLASTLSYDAKYLSQYFKKHKGIGYSYYLRNLRLDHAVFLMERGLASVKNVALLSGFSDPLYFSKIFKSVKGCPPKSYIRSLVEKGNSDGK